jgi:hypothetical protein
MLALIQIFICRYPSIGTPPGYVCRICHIPGHFIQHCLAMSAAFVIFLGILFSIAHQRTTPHHLAISATNVVSQGTLFSVAQIMVTENMTQEEPFH